MIYINRHSVLFSSSFYTLPSYVSHLFCFLFLLLAFTTSSTASAVSFPKEKRNQAIPTQIIDDNPVILESFLIGHFLDRSEKMSFEEIQQQHFELSSNSRTLGTQSNYSWAKINFLNTTNNPKKIYLHHPHAYHNKGVEVYEVVNGETIRERRIDLDDEHHQPLMFGGSAVFEITLEPNVQMSVFVKSITFSHQWFELNFYDEDQSKRALVSLYTDVYLLAGMLAALTIYNLLLFFFSRLKEHFYYACYLISGTFWVSFSYGMLADTLNVYGSITVPWHLTLVLMPIFLLMFMINIFDTHKKYPVEHWTLVAAMVLLIINFIYGLFDILTALQYNSIVSTFMLVVTAFVTVSMIIRKQPFAFIFLLGHGFFVAFSIVAVLFYKGISEFSYFNSRGLGIGILLEALTLSLIIGHRIRSVEKLKSTQAELIILATTDPLTNLYNRRYFGRAADKLLKQNKEGKQDLSIAMIDIDKFKSINDTYGHPLGDKAIKHVANIIRANTRDQDILARYGGEEFIILMPLTNLNEAHILTERIRTEIEQSSIKFNRKTKVSFTVSAGVAQINIDNPDLSETIDHADKALYKSKENGRNQSQSYTD